MGKRNNHATPETPTSPFWRKPSYLVPAFFAAVVVVAWFAIASADPKAPPGPAPEGMVWVPPSTFWMGSNDPKFEDTGPVHRVKVQGFWMDKYEVTNKEFGEFVKATGYKTVAELPPNPADFPTWMDKNLLQDALPFSLVFSPPLVCPPEGCGTCDQWWKIIPGACWKHPEGPQSSLDGREDHPVVHVCYDDAVAYAEWAGKRLPTEAEWECAARGGMERQPYYWGRNLLVEGKWMANIWQGQFPSQNTGEDGFRWTAPVGSYPPNRFGLHDMSGNVWEWCSDYYQSGFNIAEGELRVDPTGPAASIDPSGRDEPKRVIRGGSFLCSDLYCSRYKAGGRQHGEVKTGQSHTGFRCAKSP